MNKWFISFLLLSGCAGAQFDKASTSLEYKRVPRATVKQHCSQAHSPIGCAVYTPATSSCVIFAADDLPFNGHIEQLIAGHELLHCLRGEYHPKGKLEP